MCNMALATPIERFFCFCSIDGNGCLPSVLKSNDLVSKMRRSSLSWPSGAQNQMRESSCSNPRRKSSAESRPFKRVLRLCCKKRRNWIVPIGDFDPFDGVHIAATACSSKRRIKRFEDRFSIQRRVVRGRMTHHATGQRQEDGAASRSCC